MTGANDTERSKIICGVLDNIDEGIIALDAEGRITLFNPAAQMFTGISEKQALHRPVEELFPEQPDLVKLVRTGIKSGRSISDHGEFLLRRPATAPLPVSLAVSPIYRNSGERDGVVLILHDLSRIKELEKTLRRRDRLSMLGVLAAGLAHEIKNPLGGIKGAAQLLDRELAEDSGLKDFTRVMIREAERVNGIIEELMDLARPRPARMEEVQIARVLNDVVLFQREAFRKKKVDFLLDLDPSIPPLLGDPDHLTQLFVNLLKNAAEAVNENGRIEVVCRICHDFNYSKAGTLPAPVIVVEVKDNGPGIATEEIERIFTPFYSTKAKGSGLGLTICQKIAEEHGALLNVVSHPAKGTTFSFSIPFLRPKPQNEKKKPFEPADNEATSLPKKEKP
ncbi:MAG: PAS domain-containing protein [Desulfuromonadaceae bacterium]|nr:PAS domain-containing protein [Desulfuromonadaceae bacterium]